MILNIEIIPGRYAKKKNDIKRDVEELGLGLEKQCYLLNKYPIDTENVSDGLMLFQNRNAKCVEELFYENKHGKNLYTRVCQVKCVSSFLHLFPQLSAV